MKDVFIIDAITFLLSTLLLIRCVKNIKNGSKYIISILIYILYLLPLGLDCFVEIADYYYTGWWGFIIPRKDFFTNVIYDIYFLLLLYLIVTYSDSKWSKSSNSLSGKSTNFNNYLLLLGAIIPIIGVLFIIREPGMLYMFQWRELELFSDQGSYATIEKFTYIAISSSVFLLFSQAGKRTSIVRLLSILLLVTNICIEGKRAIIFFAIVNLCVVIYWRFKSYSRRINTSIYFILGILLFAVGVYVMVGLTVAVKTERGYDIADESKMYTTTRIDFLRDDRVRLSIYNSIHFDEEDIVDYPGQTYLTNIFSFIPLNYLRSFLDLKLYGYQQRFSYALEHRKFPDNPKPEVNYMTVTFIAELISNFGLFFGFLFTYWFLIWIVKLIDSVSYPINVLLICSFFLMNLFDFPYISYYLEFVFLLFIYTYKKVKI